MLYKKIMLHSYKLNTTILEDYITKYKSLIFIIKCSKIVSSH